MKNKNNEIKSTAHSKYRCQYHIVFAPKYRRKEIYGQLKKDSRTRAAAGECNALLNFQSPFQGLSQYSPLIGAVQATG